MSDVQHNGSFPVAGRRALAWVALTVAGAGVGILLRADPTARVLAIAGIWQLLGLAAVAKGIAELRGTFGLRAPWSSWRERVMRAIRRARGMREATGTVGLTVTVSGAASVSGEVTAVAPPGASVEVRLQVLESTVEGLRQRTIAGERALSRTRDELSEEVSAEAQARQEADLQLDRTLREYATGGIHVEVMGLLWLMLATIFAAWADVIGRFRWP